jgi:hypothetical protein
MFKLIKRLEKKKRNVAREFTEGKKEAKELISDEEQRYKEYKALGGKMTREEYREWRAQVKKEQEMRKEKKTKRTIKFPIGAGEGRPK